MSLTVSRNYHVSSVDTDLLQIASTPICTEVLWCKLRDISLLTNAASLG